MIDLSLLITKIAKAKLGMPWNSRYLGSKLTIFLRRNVSNSMKLYRYVDSDVLNTANIKSFLGRT